MLSVSTLTIEDTVRSPVDELKPVEDKSIPCEYYDRCETSAEYTFIRTCCGVELFVCEDCMYRVLEALKDESYYVECRLCKNTVDPAKYLRYVGRLS